MIRSRGSISLVRKDNTEERDSPDSKVEDSVADMDTAEWVGSAEAIGDLEAG